LVGKAAVVTAASQGIDKGIAEELAKEGTNVAICVRGRENLEKAAEEIRAHGAEVLTVAADVTNVEDVRKVLDETAREFGRLDILGEITLTVTQP
jgi:3-oxoacyl-[acyl-carrier protein] reductase